MSFLAKSFFFEKKIRGEDFSSENIRAKDFFRKKGVCRLFFRLKKGGEDFFSDKFFPKPGLVTRYILTGPKNIERIGLSQ